MTPEARSIVAGAGLTLVLLLLALVWAVLLSTTANADEPLCPDGWEQRWIDPVGDVCMNPDTGDPVLVAYARLVNGLPPLPERVEQPTYESPATPTTTLPGLDYDNPDCIGADCRFRDTDKPCPSTPAGRKLWAWGACQGEPSGGPVRPEDGPPDPNTGTACWFRNGSGGRQYFDCGTWPPGG